MYEKMLNSVNNHEMQHYDNNQDDQSSQCDNDEDYEDCDIDDLEDDEYIEDTKEITLHDLYQQANQQLLANGFNPKDNKRALQLLFPKLL